jgi:DedD protein
MNSIYETEDREERQEAELTLGTGTLLAIFFGLVVVCAVFFGFGYSMGRRSAESKAATLAATTPVADPATASATRPKPSAVEVLRTQGEEPAASSDDASQRTVVVDQPAPSRDTEAPAAVAPQQRQVAVKTPPKPVATTVLASPARVTPPAALQTTKPVVKEPPPTPTMVQIAAVSHPEDAEALLAALKKRGYTVVVRNEPQDKLLHVQIGPFASRAEANVMRQKLLSDGYNAIIK